MLVDAGPVAGVARAGFSLGLVVTFAAGSFFPSLLTILICALPPLAVAAYHMDSPRAATDEWREVLLSVGLLLATFVVIAVVVQGLRASGGSVGGVAVCRYLEVLPPAPRLGGVGGDLRSYECVALAAYLLPYALMAVAPRAALGLVFHLIRTRTNLNLIQALTIGGIFVFVVVTSHQGYARNLLQPELWDHPTRSLLYASSKSLEFFVVVHFLYNAVACWLSLVLGGFFVGVCVGAFRKAGP